MREPYSLEKAQEEAERLKAIAGKDGTSEDIEFAENLLKL
jgi:hypothetical protein